MIDLLFEYWVQIFAGLATLLGMFAGGKKIMPYFAFVKEIGDVYIKFKDFAKDGWTAKEYEGLGKEVVEAVEQGKITFK